MSFSLNAACSKLWTEAALRVNVFDCVNMVQDGPGEDSMQAQQNIK